ncbi:MAG: hypothetical protein HRT69_13925 [Flavobacteriaceae bacterium]|nr:hypothetical protein [Flavobacteriaceae bacterium]
MEAALEILTVEIQCLEDKLKQYEEVLKIIRIQQFDKNNQENAYTKMIDTVLKK